MNLRSYNSDYYTRAVNQELAIDESEAQYTSSSAFQTETEVLIRNYAIE
ncbi:MAG: hypothetical protein LHW56_10055 [Candidatus Cloacimonetes bacterium]|nr:hypothetical protein [Candidatus Cloacimonadota bacterium]MDY0173234.1 hypothetical protein [Candidatus Cloacimonadaceae bacterium]